MPRYNKKPKLPAHKLDNLAVAFKFMDNAGIRTFCKPQNVYECDQTMVLGLMWTLILEFDINRAMKAASAQKGVHAGQHQFDFKPGAAKDNLLGWTRAHTAPYGQEPQNFDRDFNDGEALVALVHSLRPDLFNYQELDRSDSKKNVVTAMTHADRSMGIDPLLDPDALVNGQADEKSVMAYVVQFLDYENNNMTTITKARQEFGEEVREEKQNKLRQTQETRQKLSREAESMEKEKSKQDAEMRERERKETEELQKQQSRLEEQRREMESMRAAEESRHQELVRKQREDMEREQRELDEQRRQMEDKRRQMEELEKSKLAKQKKQLEEQRRELAEQQKKVAELEKRKSVTAQKQLEAEQRSLEEQKTKMKEVEEQKRKLAVLQKKKAELAQQQKDLKEAESQRNAVLVKREELNRKKAALEQERSALQQKKIVPLQMAKEVTRMSFFTSLAERQTRDYVLFVDKSGSMAGNRWDEARKAVQALAPQVTRACPLGISLYFFNDECIRIDNITTAEQVAGFFAKEKPDRGTNLHLAMKHAFGVHNRAKKGMQPETWLIITDGAPDKPTHVWQLLKEEGKTFRTPDEVTLSFIQIGNDEHATEYLRKMRGSLNFVDTLTSEDLPKTADGAFSTLFTQQ